VYCHLLYNVIHFFSARYCYLLDDLTPELLESKSSSYEDLQEYLRKRGREAYFQKAVSCLSFGFLEKCYHVVERLSES
jgi:hypothetical protein